MKVVVGSTVSEKKRRRKIDVITKKRRDEVSEQCSLSNSEENTDNVDLRKIGFRAFKTRDHRKKSD